MTHPDKSDMDWIVSGASMLPLLKAGDLIRVMLTPFDALRIGDVVLLESVEPPCFVVHRLVGWRHQHGTRQGVLKGDNAARPDGFCLTPANYRGRVCLRQRTCRSVIALIRSRLPALLSRLNLNIMGLRRLVKSSLAVIPGGLFPISRLRRILLERSRCFVFSGKPDVRVVRLVLAGKPIAEIRLVDGRIARAGGVSVFSLILSPETIADYFRGRYPDLSAVAGREDTPDACAGDGRLGRARRAA